MKARNIILGMALLLILAVLCIGCGTAKEATKNETVRKDSTLVKVETRVEYRHDTIIEKIPLVVSESLTKDSASVLDNEYSVSYASVVDGMLYHTLRTKERELMHAVETPIVYKDSVRVEYVTMERTREVQVERQRSKWERACLWGFPLLLILLILAVFLAVRKFFLRK